MCPNVTCKDGSALLNDRRARKVRGRKGPLLKGCCSNVPVFILKAFQGGREGSYCLSVIKVEWLKIPFEGNLFSVSVVAHKIPDMQGKQAQENVAGGTGLRIRTPGLYFDCVCRELTWKFSANTSLANEDLSLSSLPKRGKQWGWRSVCHTDWVHGEKGLK